MQSVGSSQQRLGLDALAELLPGWTNPASRSACGNAAQHNGQASTDRAPYGAHAIPGADGGRKTAVFTILHHGVPHAALKIALVPGGDQQIGIEAGWLKRLEAVPGLEGQVPRLLGEGVALNGRRYLMRTLAPGGGTETNALSPAHVRFLAQLTAQGRYRTSFRHSACYQALESALVARERNLAPAELAELQAAVRDCWLLLSRWSGPFVTSQGAFTPGNVRLQGEGLFVSEWEDARIAASPFADLFDYLLGPHAVHARGMPRHRLVRALKTAEVTAHQIYPGERWGMRTVAGFALVHIVEAVLACAATRRSRPEHRDRAGGYWRLLRSRAEWLPS